MRGGHFSIDDQHVLELVVARRQDRSPLVDLGGIQQIEHRKMLHRQHPVHAFQAQTPLSIQEVGDVRLLETGLLRQPEAGQLALFDAPPQSIAEIILQHSEFHAGSIAWGYSNPLIGIVFHSPIGITTLTRKIHSYTLAKVYNPNSFQGTCPMSSIDNQKEEKSFVEFRRKVRAAEVLSAAMEQLLRSVNFSGRVSVIVQNGRVLKSGYEEGFFRQRETGSLLREIDREREGQTEGMAVLSPDS